MEPTPRISQEQALALWMQYRATGDLGLRDRLVLTFAPLVKYIVYRKVRELPSHYEVEDFISCGLEALIRSIDRYDPEKGASLEQFAWSRIHGAVLDELRRTDWAPRSVRRWERDIARATERFVGLQGRNPGPAELAAALGLDMDELRRRRQAIETSGVTSLNAPVPSEDGTTVERIDTLRDEGRDGDPERSRELGEAKAKFRLAFADLPPRDREVAVLLYVKNLTLAEIGETLGVTESRVCQIHTGLRRRLREALAADAPLFQAVA